MPRIKILTVGLVAVILISACGPAVAAPSSGRTTVASPTPQVATAPLVTATQIQAQPETLTATPVAVATSRGPNLEATDPTSVSLASGGLQLVEFFRFT